MTGLELLLAGGSAALAGAWALVLKSRLAQSEETARRRDAELRSLNYDLERALAAQGETAQVLASAQGTIAQTKQMCAALSRREQQAVAKAEAAEKDRAALEAFNRDVLSRIRAESALLPSVVEWVDRIQEMIDARDADYLLEKRNPAPKARDAVSEARADARNWRRQAAALRNQVALYETQAPWLAETLDYTVEEIAEGLAVLAKEEAERVAGADPSSAYIGESEWARLSPVERDQLALDRYFERRQRSAWLAGVAYERYVGYLYESKGFDVAYQGATLGVSDLGIDLVCRRADHYTLVQCKRLSEAKGIPVRENTVAQVYGAALFFAYQRGIDATSVTPVIVTSFELSEQAREFANALGVKFQERRAFARYPAIKCNVGKRSERIYHLPFDQQYDVTSVVPAGGDCWATSAQEATSLGFRRAFRWRGG